MVSYLKPTAEAAARAPLVVLQVAAAFFAAQIVVKAVKDVLAQAGLDANKPKTTAGSVWNATPAWLKSAVSYAATSSSTYTDLAQNALGCLTVAAIGTECVNRFLGMRWAPACNTALSMFGLGLNNNKIVDWTLSLFAKKA